MISIPRDLDRHVTRDYPPALVKKYVNRRMLYNGHLGFKKDLSALTAEQNALFMTVQSQVETLLDKAFSSGVLRPACAYRFFAAQSAGDSINVYDSADKTFTPVEFPFPRQKSGERLCLSDWVAPAASGKMDYVAMFVCTVGGEFLAEARRFRENGKFSESHLMNVVAMTCAEALAESVHADLRALWGFADGDGAQTEDVLHGAYRGKRFSFGFAACPDLELQKKLFALLRPEDIGVSLTDGLMMEPEASVSALALQNPAAKYFSLD